MPFGQYKGVDIKEIETDYLLWAINNIEDREDSRYSIAQIKYYIQKELKQRNPIGNKELYDKEHFF